MAVVNGRSNLIPDHYAGEIAPDPEIARGRPIVATGIVTNGAADSNLSMYHLADLPADCILDPRTIFDVENWGFAQVVIGTKTDTDALVDVARSAATSKAPIVFGDANHLKRLWEVLGLAESPGGLIGIWAHAEAGATGAGNMPFEFHYRWR